MNSYLIYLKKSVSKNEPHGFNETYQSLVKNFRDSYLAFLEKECSKLNRNLADYLEKNFPVLGKADEVAIINGAYKGSRKSLVKVNSVNEKALIAPTQKDPNYYILAWLRNLEYDLLYETDSSPSSSERLRLIEEHFNYFFSEFPFQKEDLDQALQCFMSEQMDDFIVEYVKFAFSNENLLNYLKEAQYRLMNATSSTELVKVTKHIEEAQQYLNPDKPTDFDDTSSEGRFSLNLSSEESSEGSSQEYSSSSETDTFSLCKEKFKFLDGLAKKHSEFIRISNEFKRLKEKPVSPEETGSRELIAKAQSELTGLIVSVAQLTSELSVEDGGIRENADTLKTEILAHQEIYTDIQKEIEQNEIRELERESNNLDDFPISLDDYIDDADTKLKIEAEVKKLKKIKQKLESLEITQAVDEKNAIQEIISIKEDSYSTNLSKINFLKTKNRFFNAESLHAISLLYDNLEALIVKYEFIDENTRVALKNHFISSFCKLSYESKSGYQEKNVDKNHVVFLKNGYKQYLKDKLQSILESWERNWESSVEEDKQAYLDSTQRIIRELKKLGDSNELNEANSVQDLIKPFSRPDISNFSFSGIVDFIEENKKLIKDAGDISLSLWKKFEAASNKIEAICLAELDKKINSPMADLNKLNAYVNKLNKASEAFSSQKELIGERLFDMLLEEADPSNMDFNRQKEIQKLIKKLNFAPEAFRSKKELIEQKLLKLLAEEVLSEADPDKQEKIQKFLNVLHFSKSTIAESFEKLVDRYKEINDRLLDFVLGYGEKAEITREEYDQYEKEISDFENENESNQDLSSFLTKMKAKLVEIAKEQINYFSELLERNEDISLRLSLAEHLQTWGDLYGADKMREELTQSLIKKSEVIIATKLPLPDKITSSTAWECEEALLSKLKKLKKDLKEHTNLYEKIEPSLTKRMSEVESQTASLSMYFTHQYSRVILNMDENEKTAANYDSYKEQLEKYHSYSHKQFSYLDKKSHYHRSSLLIDKLPSLKDLSKLAEYKLAILNRLDKHLTSYEKDDKEAHLLNLLSTIASAKTIEGVNAAVKAANYNYELTQNRTVRDCQHWSEPRKQVHLFFNRLFNGHESSFAKTLGEIKENYIKAVVKESDNNQESNKGLELSSRK